MRIVACLVAAALMAGCAADHTADATAALQAQQEDFGASGAGRAVTMTMEMTMRFDGESLSMTLQMSIDYYQGGVIKAVGTISEASGMDGMEGAGIVLYCSPSQIVFETTGFGEEDTRVDGANGLGHCFPDGSDEIEVLLSGIQGEAGMAAGLLNSAFSTTMPDFAVKDVRTVGGDLVVVYEIDAEGMVMQAESTVRDGRVVATQVEVDETMLELRIDMSFEYGSRGPAPAAP